MYSYCHKAFGNFLYSTTVLLKGIATINNLLGRVIATYAILISSLFKSPFSKKLGVSVLPVLLFIMHCQQLKPMFALNTAKRYVLTICIRTFFNLSVPVAKK